MTDYWFSYTQEEYVEKLQWLRRILKVKDKEKQFSYRHCTVQTVRTLDNKTRVILRRTNSKYSSYMEFTYTVNLMMGFVVDKTYEPTTEKITVKEKTYDAWVINFDVVEFKDSEFLRPITGVKIWMRKGTGDIKSSEIYKLYLDIQKPRPITKFFESDVPKNSDVLPVIYQPRIDAWKNFLREVHVHPLSDKDFEVTLVFNDEILRAHGPLDAIYRGLRVLIHKRIQDVETFCMHFDEPHFKFPGIYSDGKTIFEDDIHGHKTEDHPDGVPHVPIKYYFQSENHPVVFVNTSNHAMAQGDNNHDFWKWEYIPWTQNIPIIKKGLSREQVDDSFRIIKSKFWRRVFGIKDNTPCDDQL
ncbi:hypothetical protein [Nitrosopumilus sp.]|uniref:hypothetical protein n=1 Tax=Nitrosopumilus sp. TaxID=2024843 RepID=UPI00247B3253|nr:hypothetical protein [Nitrosopumilus sp.]MCV0430647.1 hypothetical protein [Nitrosopumilus sp.]